MTVLIIIAIGCTGQNTVDDSPLSTWDPIGSGISDASSGQGTLRLSDGCTILVLDNRQTILLIWPSPTKWVSSSRVVEFVAPGSSKPIDLREGDRISAGGHTPEKDREPGDPLTEEPEAQDPSSVGSSCEADEVFVVGSVRFESDERDSRFP